MYKLNKNKFVLGVIIFIGFNVNAQNPKIDKLEMLFEQGHYKRVYRKANRLLDDPGYDFSMLPTYYKGLSLVQLAQNDQWYQRHGDALTTSLELFNTVKSSEDAKRIFDAHINELRWVRQDLISWASDLKRRGLKEQFEEVQDLIDVLFEGITDLNNPVINSGNENDSIVIITPPVSDNLSLRDEIVLTAKSQIGTPYVWAGSTPEGFDCSGFTCYVMSLNGSELPRRSADQYDQSKKVKQKNVKKGDLVFFDNGSGISHVGIIISEEGEPLTMIHASTSKGVIITEIPSSTYWSQRVSGFGTFVH